MSRMLAALIFASLGAVAPAHAQQVYGPAEEFEGEEDTPNPLQEIQPCETQAQEENVILVCRELTESERYMSPLPKPVQSDRAIIPGLTDPPCWVSNPAAEGTMGCMRFGYVPPPAIIVDLTQFPEPLAEADAALVSEVEAEPDSAAPVTGERVAIDLSEEE
ncbi:MAG: hypothetical protein JY451_07140 [Erythrobacter sp.]|nr:MAG: hypothetical protein JY451_07140 [Erythrobacter sp.]